MHAQGDKRRCFGLLDCPKILVNSDGEYHRRANKSKSISHVKNVNVCSVDNLSLPIAIYWVDCSMFIGCSISSASCIRFVMSTEDAFVGGISAFN